MLRPTCRNSRRHNAQGAQTRFVQYFFCAGAGRNIKGKGKQELLALYHTGFQHGQDISLRRCLPEFPNIVEQTALGQFLSIQFQPVQKQQVRAVRLRQCRVQLVLPCCSIRRIVHLQLI